MRRTAQSLALAMLAIATVCLAPAQESMTEPREQLAIHGYCPVAYVAMGKQVKGDPNYTAMYAGKTYAFANKDAQAAFKKDPARFVPHYDGYCATAIAEGMKVESKPEYFSVDEGGLYLFSSAKAKEVFDKDPVGIRKRAEENWKLLRRNMTK